MSAVQDIVVRLRRRFPDDGEVNEAANEIEKLRGLLKQASEHLQAVNATLTNLANDLRN